MSLDIEARLKRFFSSAPQNIWSIPTLQISHTSMTTVYHLWNEPYTGQTTIEGGFVKNMLPVNFEIKLAGTTNNLDQIFDIKLDLTDIEDIFRKQLDLIPIDTTEKIRIVYREYLSDDLTSPLSSAIIQVESISYVKGYATIAAISPRLNILKTGEVYSPRDVPPLRAFS